MVDLAKDHVLVMETWQRIQEAHVPLPLAAALAFHEVNARQHAVVPRTEYEDALNLVAAALSRVVPIFALDERTREVRPLKMGLAAGKFASGAAAFQAHDGTTVARLVVPREEVHAALGLVKATGIPFHFSR